MTHVSPRECQPQRISTTFSESDGESSGRQVTKIASIFMLLIFVWFSLSFSPLSPLALCILCLYFCVSPCLCWSVSRCASLRRSPSISWLSGQDRPRLPAGAPGSSLPGIAAALPAELPRLRRSWAPASPMQPGPGPGYALGTLPLPWLPYLPLPRLCPHPLPRPWP